MYRTRQQVRWDNQNAFDYAREEGLEQGLERGLKEGREEERLKALAEKKGIAYNLKSKGIGLEIIAEATGLSIKEIASL